MNHGQTNLLHQADTEVIIGVFFEVFNALGFGFLESVYSAALERELMRRGCNVGREVLVPVHFKSEIVAFQRLDLLVNDRVVVEVKSTERLHPQAARQVFNYLRATNLNVGLLLHFGQSPKFERLFCAPENKQKTNPPNPSNPRNPKNNLFHPDSAGRSDLEGSPTERS